MGNCCVRFKEKKVKKKIREEYINYTDDEIDEVIEEMLFNKFGGL